VPGCDQLFETAPEAMSVNLPDAPRLLNGPAVGAEVERSYHEPWNRVAVVQALVQPDGRISHGCLLATSGDPRYDAAALTAARSTRWDPAMRDGKEVEAWVSFPVSTRMRPGRDITGRYMAITADGGGTADELDHEDLEVQSVVLDYLLRDPDRPAPGLHNHAVCLGVGPGFPLLNAPSALGRRLPDVEIPVVPATRCHIDLLHEFPGMKGPRLMVAGTDQEALALWADLPEHTGADVVRVRAGYYLSGPRTSDYACTVRSEKNRWEVVRCTALNGP
jgi:TonB family protein